MSRKSEIVEIELPAVTMDDIFQAEGADYSNKSPRPKTVELHRHILEEALTLVQPKLVWSEVSITGFGEKELYLEEGQKLTSKLLVRVAGTADKIISFAVTIGDEIDKRVDEYKQAGAILEAFVLDAAGTAFVVKSSTAVIDKFKEEYKRQGLEITFPMGPGHSYWESLDDMPTIFHFLKAEEVGLRLTKSNLMIPRKSVAMVIGVGSNLPNLKGKTHCDFCSLNKTCNMSHFGAIC